MSQEAFDVNCLRCRAFLDRKRREANGEAMPCPLDPTVRRKRQLTPLLVSLQMARDWTCPARKGV